MTWALQLRAGADRLAAAGIPDPMRDARLLLAHARGLGADRLTLHMADAPDPAAATRFDSLITARAARAPLSHLTGQRLFWGRSFQVSPAVLDPRPETETLVALALSAPFARVLDLGTGSGCILLSLLADRPAASGVGADLSPGALQVASGNAARLGLSGRAAFVQSDWCAGVTGTYDLIVSNPPYIAAAEMPALSPEVRDHEPHLALTDGADGLTAYRALAAQTPAHLAPGGRLLLEIGPTQGAAVAQILAQAGFRAITCHSDMDGRDRVIAARLS
jgi:release factor glutamine methyltransferase